LRECPNCRQMTLRYVRSGDGMVGEVCNDPACKYISLPAQDVTVNIREGWKHVDIENALVEFNSNLNKSMLWEDFNLQGYAFQKGDVEDDAEPII
jgi:hypothetical protein